MFVPVFVESNPVSVVVPTPPESPASEIVFKIIL